MESSLDIFQIYGQFCAITAKAFPESCSPDDELQRVRFLRESLMQLLEVVESKFISRVSVFDEVLRLKSKVEMMVDSKEFSLFYDFVFFICRENGQKSITVNRAVTAWRLVLAGRFRLLNEWCNFVEKNQRHNISEDSWRQVLAFSHCVHENLEGYDPQGAWPILIDDFVDYLYRIKGYCGAPLFCNCADPESQLCKDNILGLRSSAGTKRKLDDDFQTSPTCSKRINLHPIETWGINQPGEDNSHEKVEQNNSNPSTGCTMNMCAIEGCLSRGFACLLSGKSCIQFDPNRRVSFA